MQRFSLLATLAVVSLALFACDDSETMDPSVVDTDGSGDTSTTGPDGSDGETPDAGGDAGGDANGDGTTDVGAVCADDTCSGNGVCVEGFNGAVCVCDMGFAEPDCATCETNFFDDGSGGCQPREQCTDFACGAGTCDDSSGLIECTCDDGYTGPGCRACDAGYYSDATGSCVRNESCEAGDPCVAGTCVDDTGVVVCECFDNYAGDNCDECYPGFVRNRITGACQFPCPQGGDWIRCADGCYDPTDTASCGGCGIDCGDGVCQNLVCQCPFGAQFGVCGDTCTNLDTNAAHCGACGNACAAGESCVLGRCIVEDGTCAPEGGSSVCAPDDVCCLEDFCFFQSDVADDTTNCGGCGVTCAVDEQCVRGACRASTSQTCTDCRADELCCATADGAACFSDRDLRRDRNHCGGCGLQCGPGEVCSGGQCFCPGDVCGAPGAEVCVDLASDESHCGSCGTACADGEVCTLGACVAGTGSSCGDCELCCAGAGGDVCLNEDALLWDEAHCGACGNACDPGESCVSGVCACDDRSALCDGACTPLGTTGNCSGCGDVCTNGQICLGGTCGCPADSAWSECAGTCTFVGGDAANCGACGTVCDAGDVCDRGACCTAAGTAPAAGDPGRCCAGAVDSNGLCAVPECAAPGELCPADGACCEGECAGDGRCCLADGQYLGSAPAARCCSGDVDLNGFCGTQPQVCRGNGGACLSDGQCCSLTCSDLGECCLAEGSAYDVPGECCSPDGDLDGFCGGDCVADGEPTPPQGGTACCSGFSGVGDQCGGTPACLLLQQCESDSECCSGGCVDYLLGSRLCCISDGADYASVAAVDPNLARALCCNGDDDGDGVCGSSRSCVDAGQVGLTPADCCDEVIVPSNESVFCGGTRTFDDGTPVVPCVGDGIAYAESTAECCSNNDPDFDGLCGGEAVDPCSGPGGICDGVDVLCCTGTCTNNQCP